MTDRHSGGGRGTQRDTVVVSRRRAPEAPPPRARGVQRDTVAVTTRRPPRLRGVFQAGFVTCCWNGLVVFLPILVAVITAWWIAGRPGGVGDVVRAAGAVWIVGHGVPVTVAGLPVGLAPLLLVAVVFWRLTKAGANTVRAIAGRSFPAVRAATISVAVNYTAITTIAALAVAHTPFDVPVWRVAVNAALMSIVAGSLGALGASGGGTALWNSMPPWLSRGMHTGLLVTLMLLSAGALLSGIALASRSTAVTATLAAYPGGVLAVGLLTLVYLPTAAVWGTSYLLGPGFAIGVDTSVRIIGVELGPMPVFPLFAAIPDGPLGDAGTLLYGLPILIASVYGVRLGLRGHDLRAGAAFFAVLVTTVTSTVLIAAVTALASGPLGNARMAEVGPDPLLTAAIVAAVTFVFGLIGCFSVRLFGGGRRDVLDEAGR